MRPDQIDVLKRDRSLKVVERSEEVRLMLCTLVTNIIWYLVQTRQTSMMEECYTSILLAFQCHLRDSFPDIGLRRTYAVTSGSAIRSWSKILCNWYC